MVSTGGAALSSMRWTYPQDDDFLALRRKAKAVQAAVPTLVQYRGLKLLTGNDASVADGPV